MKYFIGFIVLAATSTMAFSQRIKIRDQKSITPVTKPLLVLDGKVLPNLVRSKNDTTKLVDPLTEIDQNDIDRVTILKNDSATSLYGDAGKNGVLIIATKAYSQESKKQ